MYAKTVTLGGTHWEQTNEILFRNRRIGCRYLGNELLSHIIPSIDVHDFVFLMFNLILPTTPACLPSDWNAVVLVDLSVFYYVFVAIHVRSPVRRRQSAVRLLKPNVAF